MDDDGLGYADEGEEDDWDTGEPQQLHHVPRSKTSKDKSRSLSNRMLLSVIYNMSHTYPATT